MLYNNDNCIKDSYYIKGKSTETKNIKSVKKKRTYYTDKKINAARTNIGVYQWACACSVINI
ncbi:MAG TPA: hypothetical protein PK733_15355 [Clostridiales bacterium]|nr:hypothetical protein [Clostridiales bacterium]